MKKIALAFASIVLLAASSLAAQQNPCNPCAKKAQNPCAKKAKNPCNPCSKKAQNPCSAKMKGKEKTVVGYIGDSQCGLEHPMNMGDAKACTLKCVDGGGKFILADRDHKTVYSLDKDAQEKAREFAGQKVKVTGHVDGKAKAIHVTKIEAAS
jgi:hypothetical protein